MAKKKKKSYDKKDIMVAWMYAQISSWNFKAHITICPPLWTHHNISVLKPEKNAFPIQKMRHTYACFFLRTVKCAGVSRCLRSVIISPADENIPGNLFPLTNKHLCASFVRRGHPCSLDFHQSKGSSVSGNYVIVSSLVQLVATKDMNMLVQLLLTVHPRTLESAGFLLFGVCAMKRSFSD